jgi:hypothetical protein
VVDLEELPQHPEPVLRHRLAAFPVADGPVTYADVRGELLLGEAAGLAQPADLLTVHARNRGMASPGKSNFRKDRSVPFVLARTAVVTPM